MTKLLAYLTACNQSIEGLQFFTSKVSVGKQITAPYDHRRRHQTWTSRMSHFDVVVQDVVTIMLSLSLFVSLVILFCKICAPVVWHQIVWFRHDRRKRRMHHLLKQQHDDMIQQTWNNNSFSGKEQLCLTKETSYTTNNNHGRSNASNTGQNTGGLFQETDA